MLDMVMEFYLWLNSKLKRQKQQVETKTGYINQFFISAFVCFALYRCRVCSGDFQQIAVLSLKKSLESNLDLPKPVQITATMKRRVIF